MNITKSEDIRTRYYHEGVREARDAALRMSREELLSLLDALYGRDRLPDECSDEQLRAEALRQVRQEFTDRTSAEYDQVRFWSRVAAAQNDGRR